MTKHWTPGTCRVATGGDHILIIKMTIPNFTLLQYFAGKLVPGFLYGILPEEDVEGHHQHEAHSEAYCADI